jgi:hypothetical protein
MGEQYTNWAASSQGAAADAAEREPSKEIPGRAELWANSRDEHVGAAHAQGR